MFCWFCCWVSSKTFFKWPISERLEQLAWWIQALFIMFNIYKLYTPYHDPDPVQVFRSQWCPRPLGLHHLPPSKRLLLLERLRVGDWHPRAVWCRCTLYRLIEDLFFLINKHKFISKNLHLMELLKFFVGKAFSIN